ncbi:hypothetical protein [Mycolicibacterium nivoides]
MTGNQDAAPLLDALHDYHTSNRYGFSPPGHRQGRGVDQRVLRVLGREPFFSDVLASGGLDDRRMSNGYLKRAEELMAEAVGARSAWFSTCGSSLSVKAAMMAVAGCDGSLLLSRDSHKSVVAGLIFSGLAPRWITPQWDAERHLSHPPSPQQVEQAWQRYPDAAAALIVSPSPYGEDVPVEKAVGRISAEQITPYPPGIPAVVPGERLNEAVLDYLRTGLAAGMNVPDPADPALHTVRVVA